jgi:hypothetical protein
MAVNGEVAEGCGGLWMVVSGDPDGKKRCVRVSLSRRPAREAYAKVDGISMTIKRRFHGDPRARLTSPARKGRLLVSFVPWGGWGQREEGGVLPL